jgi:tight adherence protein B
MLDPNLLSYAVYFLIATTVILAVEAVFITARTRQGYRNKVNHRLRHLRENLNPELVLIELRKERGLDEAGNYRYPLVFLNKLYLQSGLRGSPLAFFGGFLVVGVFLAASGFVFAVGPLLASLAAVLVAVILPILVLMRLRGRRIKRFAEQLPEAIDIVVRSLRAGHPTPVSLSLVAREMADPIGTEFGLVCDEMTYGLELDRAMRNLLERVGLDDLRLIVVSMGVQASTGGNLAEILANLAQVIRDRFRMRRKIRAVSAEGRWSAILISVFPFALFGIIGLISPSYYGEVWDHPIVQPVLAAMVGWMLFGDYIMYRMVNFDF